MRIEINFSDEELLRIIGSPAPEAAALFAEGYVLPDAYPTATGAPMVEWATDLVQGANWVFYDEYTIAPVASPHSLSPVDGKRVFMGAVGGLSGRQAA